MAKNDFIVGLDIGTTKMCAVVGEVNEEGIDIIGIGSIPSTGLRMGVVVNIDETIQSIKKAIGDAERMAGHEIKTVYAGIAGNHIRSTNSHGVIAVKGREVSPRDVERVLDAAKAVAIPQDRELLHTLPQEYVVDDQRGIANPLGMAGVRLEVKVHIVTGAVTAVQNVIRSCDRSGLYVADMVLESLASAKAVLTAEERNIGVALVDIGGGTTDIAIFINDAIKHTSALPLGGQNITKDIAVILRTPVAAAENIKKDYGCVLSELVLPEEYIDVPSSGERGSRRLERKVLVDICEPRMEEILTFVNHELVRSGFKNHLGAGIVLTGGTALIQGSQELAEQIFGLPTRVGAPRNVGGLKDVVNNPKYATAVGLLHYAAEKEGMDHKYQDQDPGAFSRVFSKMRKWFSDIS
ncbi:MAG: cell division protein FtsA [Pseudomonadota bacterium]